ncbi:MAG: phosphate acyltransferase PlsX [Nitrospirae bacterium]|nr:phosphate acyltransferase PlsX [Nitrospirota bacterium]
MKIAVDAMGGDYGLAPNVEGAVQAVAEVDLEVVLVGDEPQITDQLRRLSCSDPRLVVRHASQTVGMHESPALVARKKRDSSVWVATELVKAGEANAMVSAGNTGAAMVAAFFVLGLIKGVERPAIAATLPTLTGTAVMLDVGANVDCSAEHILQFSLMGSEYAKHVFEKPNPRIGLLSIGEEDTKGNEVTKEAFKLLKASPLNFIGNIEGRDVYNGTTDVIVCDGFIGNVALKISEGVAQVIKKMLMKEIIGSWLGRLSYFFLAGPLRRLRLRLDYAEFGGAPLLGVNGISIICHGHSSPKAIKNAILLGKRLTECRFNELIQRDIEESLAHHQASVEEGALE